MHNKVITIGKILKKENNGRFFVFTFVEDYDVLKKILLKKQAWFANNTILEVSHVSFYKKKCFIDANNIKDSDLPIAIKTERINLGKKMIPQDVENCPVYTPDDKLHGYVVGLHNFGGGDLLEIMCNATKKTEFFLMREDYFPLIDTQNNKIILQIPTYIDGDREEYSDMK